MWHVRGGVEVQKLPGFDGIIHSHPKEPETMTHIPFPITFMGSDCASSKGTRRKGKQEVSDPPIMAVRSTYDKAQAVISKGRHFSGI